jgi:hypothetical protein
MSTATPTPAQPDPDPEFDWDDDLAKLLGGDAGASSVAPPAPIGIDTDEVQKLLSQPPNPANRAVLDGLSDMVRRHRLPKEDAAAPNQFEDGHDEGVDVEPDETDPALEAGPGSRPSLVPSFIDWERAEAEGKVKTTAAAANSKIAVADAALERKLRREQAEEERKLRREALAEERKGQRKAERKQSRRERKARRQAARAALVRRARENTVGMYAMTVYATAAAVAVGGQISVAAARDWPIMFGIGMAVFIEGTALAMALTALAQRLKGEKALLARSLTWLFALFAAGINYYTHAEDQVLAVILGASSLTAITVYEIRSAAKHRDALRDNEMIGAPATQFGWRTWVVHPRLTFAAWKQDVSARLAGEAAHLMAAAVAAAEDRAARRAAEAEVERARREAKKAGLPPVVLTFTDEPVHTAPFIAQPAAPVRAEVPEDTAAAVAPKAIASPRPARKAPVKPAPKPSTTSDAQVLEGLKALAEAENGAVSIKRARREYGLGSDRAKRLLAEAGLLTTD